MISDQPTHSLPHRDPFLWVSRLMERNNEGTQGVVEFDVDPKLSVFQGHFPENPIFPGVLQMEAAAQACLWVHVGAQEAGKSVPDVLFAGVDSYKFRRPIVPPSVLRIEVTERSSRRHIRLWDIKMLQNGEVASEGSFWLMVDNRKKV